MPERVVRGVLKSPWASNQTRPSRAAGPCACWSPPTTPGTAAQFPPTTKTRLPARRPAATASAISPPISPRLTVGSSSRCSSGNSGSTIVASPSRSYAPDAAYAATGSLPGTDRSLPWYRICTTCRPGRIWVSVLTLLTHLSRRADSTTSALPDRALLGENSGLATVLRERNTVAGSLLGTLCLLGTLADDVWETSPLRVIQ